jgi:hypothetical protein
MKESDGQQPDPTSKTLGILLIITATAIAIFIPCPNGVQCFTLYTLIGIGIALLLKKSAEKASAKFNIKNTAVVLSGGVTIPFILFFTNPIPPLKGDKCRILSTNVVVLVHAMQGTEEVKLKQGTVVMNLIDKETKRSPVNDNGEAHFQNAQVGDSARLNLDFSEPYVPVSPDSIYTIKPNAEIEFYVRLKGLDEVHGIVFFNNEPLPGVKVELQARNSILTTFTDGAGYFKFSIPLPQQQQKYLANFTKNGFQPHPNEPVLSEFGAYLKITMDKN